MLKKPGLPSKAGCSGFCKLPSIIDRAYLAVVADNRVTKNPCVCMPVIHRSEMKITQECYSCLERLVRQASEMATHDPDLKASAIEQGLALLDREFSMDKTSIAVATPLHRIVRAVTGNSDPYFQMKQTEVEMADHIYRRWSSGSTENLTGAIALAVRGNTIDFFKDAHQINTEMMTPVQFAIDDTAELELKLKEAASILYLADNTGEVFFDLDLVRAMGNFGSVTYVVKESPVQNDVTLSDLKYFGFASELPTVITTGTDTPGVVMDMASKEFKAAFEIADLVLAKGMGYWETLSELPPVGKVFHLLKAKCQPVSDSLGVGLNSYVALLR